MLPLALSAMFAGAALGAGAVAAKRAIDGMRLDFSPDELHWARTKDGWELPLGRYLPRGKRIAQEPVVLCHGLGANRFNLDLNETYSVARYLAAKGWETFVVELRGTGLAKRWDNGARWRFDFDDYVEHDLPAILAKARELGGARPFWVGHSKGGIVMYAFCGSGDRSPDVSGVVAIGSPLIAEGHFPERVERTLLAGRALVFLDAIYTEPFLKLAAPAVRTGLFRTRYVADSANIDPEVSGLILTNLLGNVSSDVARQFGRWIETGRFTSADGSLDYRAGLANSRVPFQLIAGSNDLLGTPRSLEIARDAMKNAEVDYLLCSRANGFTCDYGHGDLVLGRCAPTEIFPRIESWLRRRASRA